MRLTTAGALVGVSLPVGYVIKQHVDWEQSPDSKKRMLVYHGVFWSTVAMALKFIHDTFWKYRRPLPGQSPTVHKALQLSRLVAAGLLPILGFEGGMWIARKLIPKKPSIQTTATLPHKRVYTPSYLKQNSFYA